MACARDIHLKDLSATEDDHTDFSENVTQQRDNVHIGNHHQGVAVSDNTNHQVEHEVWQTAYNSIAENVRGIVAQRRVQFVYEQLSRQHENAVTMATHSNFHGWNTLRERLATNWQWERIAADEQRQFVSSNSRSPNRNEDMTRLNTGQSIQHLGSASPGPISAGHTEGTAPAAPTGHSGGTMPADPSCNTQPSHQYSDSTSSTTSSYSPATSPISPSAWSYTSTDTTDNPSTPCSLPGSNSTSHPSYSSTSPDSTSPSFSPSSPFSSGNTSPDCSSISLTPSTDNSSTVNEVSGLSVRECGSDSQEMPSNSAPFQQFSIHSAVHGRCSPTNDGLANEDRSDEELLQQGSACPGMTTAALTEGAAENPEGQKESCMMQKGDAGGDEESLHHQGFQALQPFASKPSPSSSSRAAALPAGFAGKIAGEGGPVAGRVMHEQVPEGMKGVPSVIGAALPVSHSRLRGSDQHTPVGDDHAQETPLHTPHHCPEASPVGCEIPMEASPSGPSIQKDASKSSFSGQKKSCGQVNSDHRKSGLRNERRIPSSNPLRPTQLPVVPNSSTLSHKARLGIQSHLPSNRQRTPGTRSSLKRPSPEEEYSESGNKAAFLGFPPASEESSVARQESLVAMQGGNTIMTSLISTSPAHGNSIKMNSSSCQNVLTVAMETEDSSTMEMPNVTESSAVPGIIIHSGCGHEFLQHCPKHSTNDQPSKLEQESVQPSNTMPEHEKEEASSLTLGNEAANLTLGNDSCSGDTCGKILNQQGLNTHISGLAVNMDVHMHCMEGGQQNRCSFQNVNIPSSKMLNNSTLQQIKSPVLHLHHTSSPIRNTGGSNGSVFNPDTLERINPHIRVPGNDTCIKDKGSRNAGTHDDQFNSCPNHSLTDLPDPSRANPKRRRRLISDSGADMGTNQRISNQHRRPSGDNSRISPLERIVSHLKRTNTREHGAGPGSNDAGPHRLLQKTASNTEQSLENHDREAQFVQKGPTSHNIQWPNVTQQSGEDVRRKVVRRDSSQNGMKNCRKYFDSNKEMEEHVMEVLDDLEQALERTGTQGLIASGNQAVLSPCGGNSGDEQSLTGHRRRHKKCSIICHGHDVVFPTTESTESMDVENDISVNNQNENGSILSQESEFNTCCPTELNMARNMQGNSLQNSSHAAAAADCFSDRTAGQSGKFREVENERNCDSQSLYKDGRLQREKDVMQRTKHRTMEINRDDMVQGASQRTHRDNDQVAETGDGMREDGVKGVTWVAPGTGVFTPFHVRPGHHNEELQTEMNVDECNDDPTLDTDCDMRQTEDNQEEPGVGQNTQHATGNTLPTRDHSENSATRGQRMETDDTTLLGQIGQSVILRELDEMCQQSIQDILQSPEIQSSNQNFFEQRRPQNDDHDTPPNTPTSGQSNFQRHTDHRRQQNWTHAQQPQQNDRQSSNYSSQFRFGLPNLNLQQLFCNLLRNFYYEAFIWIYLNVCLNPRSSTTRNRLQFLGLLSNQTMESVLLNVLLGYFNGFHSGRAMLLHESCRVLGEVAGRGGGYVDTRQARWLRELAVDLGIHLNPRQMLRSFSVVVRDILMSRVPTAYCAR